MMINIIATIIITITTVTYIVPLPFDRKIKHKRSTKKKKNGVDCIIKEIADQQDLAQ